MKSTTFVVIASVVAVAMANTMHASDSTCKGKWCYNRRLGTEQACCKGSTCVGSLALINYCS